MKNKFFLLIILAAAFYLGTLIGNPYKTEVVDLSGFTDYYEENAVENGGWSVEESNYYIFEKEYTITSDEAKDTTVTPVIPPVEEKEEDSIPEKREYIVKQGDTLSEIAESNGMGLSVLMANNPGVSAKNLKVGQKLTILTGNGIFYKVVKGDSLSKIATLFGVEIEDIKSINKLDSNVVQVGDTLFIKDPNLNKYLSTRKQGGTTPGSLGFIMPIKYTGVTSPQGNRFHPVLKRYIYHAGVDLRAHFIPLYASKAGKVTYAGTMSGYGKIIIIQHSGGYETRYAHLDKIGVKKGQYVETGELIGKTGKSGRVTGPHLHFELRKNGKILNPMKYIPTK